MKFTLAVPYDWRDVRLSFPVAAYASYNGVAQREAAPAVQGEPVAYIRQEDFEFILADDKSEPYGTRQAPVFSRNDCRAPVPLYTSPQPHAQDVEALLRQALKALRDIRSISYIDSAMNQNPFTLSAVLAEIHHIADTALAKEERQ